MLPSLQVLHHEPSEPASSVAQGDALCHTSRVQTLADLRHWIDCLSEGQQRETPVHRLRQTLAVLELGASRDSRKQLQGVLKSWGIKQKDSSNKKNLLVIAPVHGRRGACRGEQAANFGAYQRSSKLS